MCGRYSLTQTDGATLQSAYQLSLTPEDLPPRYNIAPSQDIPVVALNQEHERALGMMRWGFMPSWAKANFKPLINARAETLHEKASFKGAFARRRCLIVADGFYEWRVNEDGSKTPFRITLDDGRLMGLAGIWERWTEPEEGETFLTCSIVTTEANPLLESIHTRMPVILPPEQYGLWLDPDSEIKADLQPLLKPYPAEAMRAYVVSNRVNNARYDGADLIDPV